MIRGEIKSKKKNSTTYSNCNTIQKLKVFKHAPKDMNFVKHFITRKIRQCNMHAKIELFQGLKMR